MPEKILLFALLLGIVPMSAQATESALKEDPTPEVPIKIQPRFWYHLAALPAYSFTADNVHEGSHALMALALGHRIERYEPYPHSVDFGDGQKHFVFGFIMLSDGISFRDEALFAIAPSITNLTLMMAADLTLSNTNPDSWYAPVIWFSCLLWPLIDWTFHMNAPGVTSDVTRFAKLAGLDRLTVAVAGDVVAAVMLWRLLHHGARIFLTRGPSPSGDATIHTDKNDPAAILDSLAITPAFGPNFTGLGLAGNF